MMKKLIISIVFLGCFMLSYSQKDVQFNLYDLFESSRLTIQNRKLVAIDSLSRKYVRVSENGKEGIIWLPIHDFKKGVVKIEMRGKDVLQKSFIGVVFHGQDDITYDAVYCRPFNFLAKDSVRRIHAIQYISHPTYTWKKLREERNGAFEKEIKNPPNPNGWFTMTLVVENKVIKAYINDSEVPSLEVEKLTNIKSGKLGIFVGDGSGGDFENILIKME